MSSMKELHTIMYMGEVAGGWYLFAAGNTYRIFDSVENRVCGMYYRNEGGVMVLRCENVPYAVVEAFCDCVILQEKIKRDAKQQEGNKKAGS